MLVDILMMLVDLSWTERAHSICRELTAQRARVFIMAYDGCSDVQQSLAPWLRAFRGQTLFARTKYTAFYAGSLCLLENSFACWRIHLPAGEFEEFHRLERTRATQPQSRKRVGSKLNSPYRLSLPISSLLRMCLSLRL